MSAVTTLIVSATRAEARYVPADARLLICGIGKVTAAMRLTRELATAGDHPVTRVINVGTAGALHGHHAGLFRPSTVVEHDISAGELRAMDYPVVDRWEIGGGDGTVLASGDTFVTDPDHRDRLAREADLVDMEGAALARVCAEFELPLQLVKVVSDNADEDAMDWPAAVDGAARLIGDWLRSVPA